MVDKSVKARSAVTFYFVFLGFLVGNWVARIPDVKRIDDLSNGLLGVCLVFGAIGAVAALPIVTVLSSSYGSSNTCIMGSILCLASVPGLGLGRGISTLIPALFLLGMGMAGVDVSVNVQAVLTEKCTAKHLMGSYFATGSLGTMAGALVGGVFAQYDVSPFRHFIYIDAFALPFCLIFYCLLFSPLEEKEILGAGESDLSEAIIEETAQDSKPSKTPPYYNITVIYLCFIGLSACMIEGGISDWATVYFRDNLHSSPIVASVGFGSFAFCIAIGRFSCDYLSARYERRHLVKFGAVICSCGMSLIVLAPSIRGGTILVAISGLVIAGLSLSVISPIVTSSAGAIPGMTAHDGIATVSGVVYMAYLIGPPLFGGLSWCLGSLRWSLLVITVISALSGLVPAYFPHNDAYVNVPPNENDEDEDLGDQNKTATAYTPFFNSFPRIGTAAENSSSSKSSDMVLDQAIFDTDVR
jgi:MFS family permease